MLHHQLRKHINDTLCKYKLTSLFCSINSDDQLLTNQLSNVVST